MRANTRDNIAVKSETLFKPINWLAKIAFINHLVLLNNVLMAVLAEHGGGKTSFVKLLRQGLDESVKSLVFKADPPFVITSLLDELGQFFYLDLNTLKSISDVIEHVNREKIKFLLIIDDAQNLPAIFLHDVLTGIKQFEKNEFFHVCLVSDFTQMAHLSTIESNEFPELIHMIELGPLTESETSTYLLQKSKLSTQINKNSLDAFYQLTGGYMARINSQMSHFFSETSPVAKKSAYISPKWFTVGASAMVLLLVSIYVLQAGFFSVGTTVAVNSVPESNLSLRSSQIPVPPEVRHAELRLAIDSDAEEALLLDMADNAKAGLLLKTVPILDDQIAPQMLTSPAEERRPSPPEAKLKVAKKISQKPVSVKLATQPAKVIRAHGQYTIQLMASQRIDVLRQFIKAHGILRHAKISISKRDGVNWYVLTVGNFGKMAQAKSYLDSKHGDLAKMNPWIRSVRGLVDVG